MNHFFLLNEAIELEGDMPITIEVFMEGIEKLNAINKGTVDEFQRHESIWKLPIFALLFSQFGQRESLVVSFVNQMVSLDSYVDGETTYDSIYPNDKNAFLGINFEKTGITVSKQITNETSFFLFKNTVLWDFSFRNFWERRTELFPNLILCGDVEAQIGRIGSAGYFNQIVEKLRDFNDSVKNWDHGDFNYKAINRDYPLRISPESTQTMSKYGNERLFSFPNGGREHFELHIKTGDLRFHFLPDNIEKKVYVGYIGPHLSTISG